MTNTKIPEEPGSNLAFFDKRGLEYELYKLKKTPDGQWFDYHDNRWKVTLISLLEGELEEQTQMEQAWHTQRAREGHEPGNLPPHLVESRAKREAKLKDARAKLADIEKQLKAYEEQEERIEQEVMLQYGPRGWSKGDQDGTLTRMDGQKLKLMPDNVLIINDPRSKYNQMRVSDYRKMGKEWLKSQKKRQIEKFEKMKETARADGLPIPIAPPVQSLSRVRPEDLPAWPEFAKPYKQNEK
jgi:hypothetical protein